jgi:transcription elongation GreA/GreB family factor
MSALPDKRRVLAELVHRVEQTLDVALRAAEDARKGATHEENRSEGDKDMRATEQSYVARGQAMRAEELGEAATRLALVELQSFEDRAIAATALVEVEDEEGKQKLYFLLAWGAGIALDVDGAQVTVISPASPMGRSLLGKRQGDDVELSVRGQARAFEVTRVA